MKAILKKYTKYHPKPNTRLIKKAYDLAKLVYHGEMRFSGEDWFDHANSVAQIVTELKMDTTTICAAYLHDSCDFGLTLDEIEKEVSPEVRKLVENTQLIKEISKKYNEESFDEEYADYLRRVIVTTGRDLRAVVIRLSDKLDDLRTINVFSEEEQDLAIKKAFEIYAPLADLIGVHELKWRLEDKAFSISQPKEYDKYREYVFQHPYSQESKVREFTSELRNLLKSKKVRPIDIFGRTKQIYSFYNKTQSKAKEFGVPVEEAIDKVNDRVAFTILVKNKEDCYGVLDVINQNFDYLEEELDDYITKPKPNGYKSIQTTVKVEGDYIVEIQIKTVAMHEHNEYGPASHIYYKLHGSEHDVTEEKISVLRNLLSWREKVLEDLTLAKTEKIEQTIFVFTPKGDIIEFPRGATPIDFAYHIHTDIGNKAVRAKVDGKMQPLSYELKSGELIEIETDKNRKKPNLDWLGFAKTKHARFYIKKYARINI